MSGVPRPAPTDPMSECILKILKMLNRIFQNFVVFEPRDLDFWIPLALLSVSTKFRADPTRFDIVYEGCSAHVGGRQIRQGTQVPSFMISLLRRLN